MTNNPAKNKATASLPQEKARPSFIADARRAQIIQAAIATLDEVGYANASLAQIAKRSDFSTALISYHFRDKDELMNLTLMTLLAKNSDFVLERVRIGRNCREKLRRFIASSLQYQSSHRPEFNALVEIVFHTRTPENVPYYKLAEVDEIPLEGELLAILQSGLENGEFRKFNPLVMSKAIQGAIGKYMANGTLSTQISADLYGEELVRIFERALLREKKSEHKGSSTKRK